MWMSGALFAALGVAGPGHAADSALKDRTIAYVLSDIYPAFYQSKDGKEECPKGLNNGPREEFKILFPDDGKKRTILETQLFREGEIWNPRTNDEGLPYLEAQGKTGHGLNLDGKIGPNDFTSPDGEKGIDNQMYRAIGCVANHRGPDGTDYHFVNTYTRKFGYNRVMIELTNVDSLADDNDVGVTIYRGLDPLMSDALGEEMLPGGTQRIDYRWGKKFIRTFHGKIADGVLTTEPGDALIPQSTSRGVPNLMVRDWRLRLKLTPDSGNGLMAGYADIDEYYYSLGINWSTHHRSYGQESLPSEYRAMSRLADAYPDPKTGKNTAISTAWQVKFQQVFILHPPKATASGEPAVPARAAGR
jgi:hypothetical protein